MKEEMTANEMADKCNRLQGEIILGFLADCATMLRQQAEEIKALKDKLEATKRFAFDMNIRAVKAEKCELTDKEIADCIDFTNNDETNLYSFARTILKKASEK
jgi:hypothetical protein